MSDTVREKFEQEYKCGDECIDALSLCTNPDGTYQQALARMCFKWFCKGQAAQADAGDLWQPIATIPKYDVLVYLKNRKGQIDTGYVYGYEDEDGKSRDGIGSHNGFGDDNNDMGYSFWKPLEPKEAEASRDARALVEELLTALNTCKLFAGCEREYDEQLVDDAKAKAQAFMEGKV
jgi:hypothetical protein